MQFKVRFDTFTLFYGDETSLTESSSRFENNATFESFRQRRTWPRIGTKAN